MLFLRILSPACFLCQIPKRFISFTPRNFFIALIAVSMASCSNNDAQKVSGDGSQGSETQIVKTANVPETEKKDALSFTEADIKELKDKFVFDEKTGWYHHKHWGQKLLKRRTLTADVNRSGYYMLHSNYFAAKKLNHTGVQVKIGEESIISEKIALDSDHHRKVSDSKGEFELNSYAKYGDNGIFQKIGKSGDTSINVRFITKKGYTEQELSKADQQALQDCFRLSLILRQLKDK